MASSLLFFSLLLFNLQVSMAGSNIAFEDGYTVSTVIDGHEFQINPRSILPQFGSSDLIILDSANSAFYTVSFSKSQGTYHINMRTDYINVFVKENRYIMKIYKENIFELQK
ncbi:hypothetical protein CsSME_00036973 [Camellia sinensis var. sinensis]